MVPLVTVAVTTYNSASFVIDTLESVKMQSYGNIELIVSDDGSIDNSVALAREWVTINQGRFERVDVITVAVNTGVSANCNRCLAASKAEWVKFIAGDDMLLPNCITDNVRYVLSHPCARVLFSKVQIFRNSFDKDNFVKVDPEQFPDNIMATRFSSNDQFNLLLLSDRITFTPSFFFSKQAVLSVGGYDELNKLCEDYPMWLKLTQSGVRLDFMDTITVNYRQHDKALSNSSTQRLFKPLVLVSYAFRKVHVLPYLPWDIAAAERWNAGVCNIFHRLGWNRQTILLRSLYLLLRIYINPFQYIISFQKRVLKAGRSNVFYAN